jgi:hypothetical protein
MRFSHSGAIVPTISGIATINNWSSLFRALRKAPTQFPEADLYYLRVIGAIGAATALLAAVAGWVIGTKTSFIFAFQDQALRYTGPLAAGAACAAYYGLHRICAFLATLAIGPHLSAFIYVLSYMAHATGRPEQDALLRQIDLSLGFDWIAYVHGVLSRPLLAKILLYSYNSMIVQLPLAPVFLMCFRPSHEAYRFAAITAAAGLVGVFLAMCLPAISMLEWASGDFNVGKWTAATPRHIVMLLRDHKFDQIDASHPMGMLTFPSFHTLSACAMIYLFWRSPLRIPATALNVLVMAAALVYGAHYLVDVLSAIVVFSITAALLSTHNAFQPLKRTGGFRIGLARSGVVASGSAPPPRLHSRLMPAGNASFISWEIPAPFRDSAPGRRPNSRALSRTGTDGPSVPPPP